MISGFHHGVSEICPVSGFYVA